MGLTRQDCGELVERVLELMAVALEKGQQVLQSIKEAIAADQKDPEAPKAEGEE